MDFVAKTKSVRISPRKVRLVASVLRNQPLAEAFRILSVLRKRPAQVLEKTFRSAVANAVHNGKVKEENLVIKQIEVFEGPALKRFHHSTRGRVHPYKKRASHITIVLADDKSQISNIKTQKK